MGLEAVAKLASIFASDAFGESGMTYCLRSAGAGRAGHDRDTRTNAGLDNVSTFRKLHIFTKPASA
jgi:hypothetical protein